VLSEQGGNIRKTTRSLGRDGSQVQTCILGGLSPCGLPIIKYEVNQTINLKICRSEGGRSWSNLMPTI